MPIKPPASVGMSLAEVDTPALLIDLDAFEGNLKRMAAFARKAGIRVRPHAKTHKSADIAKRQIALGAVGVCCQKVSEAEAMVDGGVGDVLVTNEVAGAAKLARLAALAKRATIGVCVDDVDSVAEIEAAADHAGSMLDVLVEIDVGGRRCGAAPGAAAARIAARVAAARHLCFAGLQAYQGAAQHVRAAADRHERIAHAVACVRETQAALRASGLEARAITGAGTGTYENETASGVYTELQPGSYVFMDADYARNLREDGGLFDTYQHALFVHARVMSAPASDRRIVDAGLKTFAIDAGMPTPWKLDGAVYHRPSDEHGILDVSACERPPARGSTVLLVPGHCDPTVNLHDWYIGVRGLAGNDARVECIWPVTARGALF
jgi:D-serine deaminase-like pyridoxal phosphate-dependent protein